MNGFDEPPPPAAHDLTDLLATADAALAAAWAARHELEEAIRQAATVEELATLHEQWGQVILDLEAADQRQAELLALVASMN